MKKTSFDIPDKDERGVSPVIGVILMVAITVILAAVIASFVLGFGSSVSQNVNAGVDITSNQGDPGTAEVTWISQGNADYVNVTVTSQSNGALQLSDVGEVAVINETDSLGYHPGNNTIGLNVSNGNQNTEVTIVVKAVKDETTTVVEKDTVTI